jgi:hypothetical protein
MSKAPPNSTPTAPTGVMLSAARRHISLTQCEVASAARIHVNSVKRLERAETVTSWYALGRVARVLLDKGAAIPEAWLNWPAAQRAASPPPRSIEEIFAKSDAKAEAEFQRYLNRTGTRACARARHGVLSAGPIGQLTPVKLRCEARTRAGTACRCKALKNGRCKFHGGMSTGPRTLAGRQRIAEAQRQRWESYREGRHCRHNAHRELGFSLTMARAQPAGRPEAMRGTLAAEGQADAG